jgi:hypothetical protein
VIVRASKRLSAPGAHIVTGESPANCFSGHGDHVPGKTFVARDRQQ